MRRHLLPAAIVIAGATAISQAYDALAQQLATPPEHWLPELLSAGPESAFWLYVGGLAAGGNAAYFAATGEPLYCGAHKLEDIEATRDVILDFVVHIELNEYAILEAVVPAAFAVAYPCAGAVGGAL
jgi:hypothetical protein